jgi:probable rRNA maturation factor
MILVDPDLDPEPTSYASTAKRAPSADPIPSDRKLRLPSARTLSRFLSNAQAAVRLRGQVTVLLTTDAAIRRLNRKFRGKNKATDVLSFPADLSFHGQPEKDRVAGDLAISVTTALRQAREQNHPLAIEIKILILHGLLHLAGYDHEIDNGKMARRERLLRTRLRLPEGLIERTHRQIPTTGGIHEPAKKGTTR